MWICSPLCQIRPQPANRRSAAFWQPSSTRCGRSSVVFTEGFDPGPMDRGSDPEACEIGGLGTLSRWGLRDWPPMRVASSVASATEGRL